MDLTQFVIDRIAEYFGDYDDSDDAMFGDYARIERDGETVIIRHETDDAVAVAVTVRLVSDE